MHSRNRHFIPPFSLIFWVTFSQTQPTADVLPSSTERDHFLLVRHLIHPKPNIHLPLFKASMLSLPRLSPGKTREPAVKTWSCDCIHLAPCSLRPCKVSMEEFHHGCHTHHGVILKKNVPKLALCHGVLQWVPWAPILSFQHPHHSFLKRVVNTPGTASQRHFPSGSFSGRRQLFSTGVAS